MLSSRFADIPSFSVDHRPSREAAVADLRGARQANRKPAQAAGFKSEMCPASESESSDCVGIRTRAATTGIRRTSRSPSRVLLHARLPRAASPTRRVPTRVQAGAVPIHDGNASQPFVFHDRPHFVKPIVRATPSDHLRHDRAACRRTGAALAMPDLAHDVSSRDDANHSSRVVANDNHVSRGLCQRFGHFCELRPCVYCQQPVPGNRQN